MQSAAALKARRLTLNYTCALIRPSRERVVLCVPKRRAGALGGVFPNAGSDYQRALALTFKELHRWVW